LIALVIQGHVNKSSKSDSCWASDQARHRYSFIHSALYIYRVRHHAEV